MRLLHRDFRETICRHASGLNRGKTWSNRGSNKHWMKCFPHRERVFFCLTSSRGILHVLLSSSVPLILPLILHCPHVKSKVHIQTEAGQQSRGYQSMKWKKKTTPSASLSPTQPRWNSTPPDKADKVAWSANSDGQWSTVATMLCRGNIHLLKQIHRILQLQLEKQIIQLLVTWIYTGDKQ